jgi:hypothetical protein
MLKVHSALIDFFMILQYVFDNAYGTVNPFAPFAPFVTPSSYK